MSGAKRSFSKSAKLEAGLELVACLLALFLGFRLKGLENLDKHLDEVDIMEPPEELEAVEEPSLELPVEPPKRRA